MIENGKRYTRRQLLCRGTVAAVAGPQAVRAATPANAELDITAFWSTVRALQEHLFPPVEGTPSAAEINADGYLSAVLLDPRVDPAERELLSRGVHLLDAFARRRYEQPFVALDEDARETILRRIEDNPEGQRWLSLVVYYLLEALLVDPVYGGNLNGTGWRWLAHDPGFPRPPHGWYEAPSDDA